jgi:hypothetical protein
LGYREKERLKRERILNSQAFKTWWEARQEVDPTPADPYRAYMIDKSLNAVIEPIVWDRQPNRRDRSGVDSPREGIPTYAPAKKPPKRIEPPYKSPELPRDPSAASIHKFSGDMAANFGMVAPAVKTHREIGPLGSFARTGLGRYGGPKGEIARYSRGEIHIGVKGKLTPQKIATTAHETGHVIHAQNLFERKPALSGLIPYSARPKVYSDEHEATKLAKQFLKKTQKPEHYKEQAWFLRYAIGTYSKSWKLRGDPVKFKDGKLLGGGGMKK